MHKRLYAFYFAQPLTHLGITACTWNIRSFGDILQVLGCLLGDRDCRLLAKLHVSTIIFENALELLKFARDAVSELNVTTDTLRAI